MKTTKEIEQYVAKKGVWGQGYGIQQWQNEVAPLIASLLPRADQYRRFLEIGAAAGGTARLLDDFLSFESIHIIDDNALGLQEHRHQNIPGAVEWIGDSCSEECLATVKATGLAFDLIHIDAGHSYDCVSSDTRLAVGTASPGATIFLHDVLCCEGITLWVKELREGAIPGLEYQTTFGNELGLGVFQWK